MRRAIRLFGVALVLAAGFVVLGHAPGAWACSCGPYESEQAELEEGYAYADLVFAGEAKSSYAVGPPKPSVGQVIAWTFEVDSVQKGNASDPQVVSTTVDDGGCGFEFTVGRRYQVFAAGQSGRYSTDLCSGTHVLAAGKEPFSGRLPPTGVRSAPLLAAALLVGAASVLSLARYLRTRAD